MTGSSSNVKQDLSLESFITMVRQDPDLKAEIKAALNQAKEKVEEMSAEEMKKLNGGLPLHPGMKMPF